MGRTIIVVLALFAAMFFYTFASVDCNATEKINTAFSHGQVESISQYLAQDVELSMHNTTTQCSKHEVLQVLNEFFRQNKPQDYICDNNSKSNSGSLHTADGKTYKVIYTLKNLNNQNVITGLYVY
ncbi:MAG: DUF4783 domain-containing protein [Bacteroidales bacterium]|nr:DUF4783 domain-containing protein [Bacteroidales bacterium]